MFLCFILLTSSIVQRPVYVNVNNVLFYEKQTLATGISIQMIDKQEVVVRESMDQITEKIHRCKTTEAK